MDSSFFSQSNQIKESNQRIPYLSSLAFNSTTTVILTRASSFVKLFSARSGDEGNHYYTFRGLWKHAEYSWAEHRKSKKIMT